MMIYMSIFLINECPNSGKRGLANLGGTLVLMSSDGINDATSISNAFASHFVKVYDTPSGFSGGDNLNTDSFLASLVHSDVDATAIYVPLMLN